MALMQVILWLLLKLLSKKVYNLHMFIGYAPLSFILSILFCIGLMYLDKKAAIAGDINVRESAQTLHTKSISRFGGVAIYLSTILVTYLFGFDWNTDAFFILICCLPAFLVGFIDDLKFSLDPRFRIVLLLPVPILFFYFFVI